MIPCFSTDMRKIIDVLDNRHGKANEMTFGFIKDRLTISIDSDFQITEEESYEFLSQLKKIQSISNRLEINLEISDFNRF